MSTITERPAGHLAPEAVAAILRAAVLAPSTHNTQPWTFAVAPGAIHLRADRTRPRAGDELWRGTVQPARGRTVRRR
jgi:nitroreductase